MTLRTDIERRLERTRRTWSDIESYPGEFRNVRTETCTLRVLKKCLHKLGMRLRVETVKRWPSDVEMVQIESGRILIRWASGRFEEIHTDRPFEELMKL